MSEMYPEYSGRSLAKMLVKEEITQYLQDMGYEDYSAEQDVDTYLDSVIEKSEKELEDIDRRKEQIEEMGGATLAKSYNDWVKKSLEEGIADRECCAMDDIDTIEVYNALRAKWEASTLTDDIKDRVLLRMVEHLSSPCAILMPKMTPKEWQESQIKSLEGSIKHIRGYLSEEASHQEIVRSRIKQLRGELGFLYNDD